MVYRAKITKIQSWAENHYNMNVYTFVHDAKDVYIEVDDEDEAELLESINKMEEKRLELELQWHEKMVSINKMMESINKMEEKLDELVLQWHEKYNH